MHNRLNVNTGSLPWVFKALCNIPSQANHPPSSSSSSVASRAGCENLCHRALLRPPTPFVSSKTPEPCHMTSLTIPHLSLRLPVKFLWVILGGKKNAEMSVMHYSNKLFCCADVQLVQVTFLNSCPLCIELLHLFNNKYFWWLCILNSSSWGKS